MVKVLVNNKVVFQGSEFRVKFYLAHTNGSHDFTVLVSGSTFTGKKFLGL